MRTLQRAFTLIELLVAMAVLALLVVVVASIVDYTNRIVMTGRDQMDTDSEARLVLDRIGQDIGTMLRLQSLDYVFEKQPGNDRFAFHSAVSGFYPGITSSPHRHTYSLVGYQINTDFQLERVSRGLTWGSNPSVAARPLQLLPVTLVGAHPDLWDEQKQVLSHGVYRIELNFLLEDGSISDTPFLSTTGHVDGMRDVVAVIVAVAVIPPRARVIGSIGPQAVSALPDVNGSAPLASWQTELDSGQFAGRSGLPPAAASAVRVYQRYFYLP